MASLRDQFPFGDLDDEVVATAAVRFPGLPADHLAAGLTLGRAIVDTLDHLTGVLDEAGLTPARWRLLIALVLQAPPEGATMGELAAHLDVREPTVTATVDRLERERLVARTRTDDDRRVIRVSLTAEGLTTVTALLPTVATRLHTVVAALGGPEAVRSLAGRVRTAINKTPTIEDSQ